MPVKPRGTSWQATVHHKGERIRKDFSTKSEAEIWEAQTKLSLLQGKAPEKGKPKVPTFQDLLDDVKVRVWGPKKAADMLIMNGQAVVDIVGRDRLIDSLSTADAHKVRSEFMKRGRSDATINRKLAALSVLFREAYDLGYLAKKPKVGITKERQHRTRFFTPEEERKMLTWCENTGHWDLKNYIIISLDTGFRQGEFLKIEARDVKGSDLWTYDTKGGTNRCVPLSERARLALEGYVRRRPEGRLFPWEAQTIRDWWRKMQTALGMAGDSEYLPHTLRHTFVTRLLGAGVDIKTASVLAGHKDITTTQRYAQTSTDFQRLAIQRLSAYTPHATM